MGWFLNDELFDFGTLIIEPITLISKWEEATTTPGEGTVVTATSPETSKNVVDGTTNIAADLGLDANIFSVYGYNNSTDSSSGGIGLYTEIRIYGHRQSGNGALIEFAINENYAITNIEINFVGSTNNATGLLVLGDEEISLAYDDLRNVTQNYQDLNITKFTLKNTDNTGSSNGQIRIYADRATGNGNKLQISINEDYIITNIKFTFGASTNSPTAIITLGEQSLTINTTDLANTDLIYDNLEVNVFSIKNTQSGGSSNAQIYILSIEITYEPAAPKPEYEVDFDLGYPEAEVLPPVLVTEGKKVVKPEDPEREGFVFLGWFLNAEAFDFETPITKNIILVAKWEDASQMVTVTFMDGVEEYRVIFVDSGAKVEKPEDPVKEGFVFVAWQLDGVEFDFDTAITENLELVAKWKLSDSPGKQDEILVYYDFTQFTGKKGAEFSNAEDLVSAFNAVANNEELLTSAANVAKIYQGNGGGGGDYEQTEGVLKTGTGSVNGTMTLTFSQEITKVSLLLRGWGASDTLEINGVKITLPTTLQEITIELNEPSKTLAFTFGTRALIEKITIIG